MEVGGVTRLDDPDASTVPRNRRQVTLPIIRGQSLSNHFPSMSSQLCPYLETLAEES